MQTEHASKLRSGVYFFVGDVAGRGSTVRQDQCRCSSRCVPPVTGFSHVPIAGAKECLWGMKHGRKLKVVQRAGSLQSYKRPGVSCIRCLATRANWIPAAPHGKLALAFSQGFERGVFRWGNDIHVEKTAVMHMPRVTEQLHKPGASGVAMHKIAAASR